MVTRNMRQEGIIASDAVADATASVIGVGGLGSFAALALAKMGIGKLILWDSDGVETHNLANQAFGPLWVGQRKTAAMNNLLADVAPWTQVEERGEFVTGCEPSDITVGCVDSMVSRREIWGSVWWIPLYIDARAGAELLRVITVPRGYGDEYIKTLYPDSEALPLPCSARAIVYTGMMAGAVIASIVKQQLTGGVAYGDMSIHVPTMHVV